MNRPFYNLTFPGWSMLCAACVLCGVGILCIAAAEHIPDDAWLRQLSYLGLALVGVAVVLRIGYLRLGRWSYLLFALGLVLLALLVLARALGSLPMIRPINHAYRWISLPLFSFQPSEYMKVAFVLGLAWHLRHKENVQRFRGLVGPFVMTIIPVALIVVQPDLGTAALLMPVLFIMLFVAGARLRHFALVMLLGLISIPVFWSQLHGYQRDRIAGFLLQHESFRNEVIANPQRWSWLCSQQAARNWEKDDGFQLIGAINALGTGGLFGKGWRQGTYLRYDLLPAKHNDFIFPIIGEQWGLVGCVAVLSCYLVIVTAGLHISRQTADPFGRLLAVGAVSVIGTQLLINVGMNLGLTPITGINLPFVSHGGSSLLVNFLMLGLVVSVSQKRPFLLARRPFEKSQLQHAGLR